MGPSRRALQRRQCQLSARGLLYVVNARHVIDALGLVRLLGG